MSGFKARSQHTHTPSALCSMYKVALLYRYAFFLCCAVNSINAFLSATRDRKAHNNNHFVGLVANTNKDHHQSDNTTKTPDLEFMCQSCNQTFSSRNALFRHLRSSDVCAPEDASLFRTNELVKQAIALKFSYSPLIVDSRSPEEYLSTHFAREAGDIVEQSVINSLGDDKVHVNSRTQSSLARLRPKALEQEADVAAVGDVLVLSVSLPKSTRQRIASPQAHILQDIQLHLDRNQQLGMLVHVEAVKFLHEDTPLHAERSCTQLAYHYFLPFEWLSDSKHLLRWSNTSSPPPTESLRRLKKALRSAESRRFRSTEISLGENDRVASGRFGALSYRERRAWHNFAIQRISPNHDTAWRVLDRCRIAGFFDNHAIIEVRGDALLQGEVRAIVAMALAIANGWLPTDAIRKTTHKGLLLPIPFAPSGLSYLADVKFHFFEMRTGGRSLFDSSVGGDVFSSGIDQIHRIQNDIVLQRQSNLINQRQEAQWLKDLECHVAPSIMHKLQEAAGRVNVSSVGTQRQLSPKYVDALEQLQSIVDSGRWPETSTARHRVIVHDDSQRETLKRGSFTIVNPDHPVGMEVSELPQGNRKFPRLVDAVFSLEKELGKQTMLRVQEGMKENYNEVPRQSSSHCAINFDAQFTPHVDSGRGKGQQLSMIVGLGDYAGGDLVVEGETFDIRYEPLEFDGWKLRHWTAPFAGKRFSLVWFTPALD